MTDPLRFTYTDADWAKIKDVVLVRLGRDADQIELTRPAGKIMQLTGTLTTTTSLRSAIETAASLHIVDSALDSQTLAHKDRIKELEEMRVKADALHGDLWDATTPSFTLGDNGVRRVVVGLREKYGLNVDPLDEAGRAFATVIGVIDACIASLTAQPPQQTANSRKIGRDRFWEEMLMIWIDIGGAEKRTPAAEWLVATSNAVFDRVWDIGGRKTAISASYGDDDTLGPVVEWLRLRAKARQATS